jgi:hypothetical protein
MPAELSRAGESGLKEMTSTENVSPQGVHVTTVQRWQTGTRVLVNFSLMAFGLKEGSLTASASRAAASPLGWSYPDSCKPHRDPAPDLEKEGQDKNCCPACKARHGTGIKVHRAD